MLHQLFHFLIADGIGIDSEIVDVGLSKVFVAPEGSTAYPTVGGSILEDFSKDGHLFIAAYEFALLLIKRLVPDKPLVLFRDLVKCGTYEEIIAKYLGEEVAAEAAASLGAAPAAETEAEAVETEAG